MQMTNAFHCQLSVLGRNDAVSTSATLIATCWRGARVIVGITPFEGPKTLHIWETRQIFICITTLGHGSIILRNNTRREAE
jgi:hypothetical protein